MMTQEEIRIVFESPSLYKNVYIKIEDNSYVVWDNSIGHEFKTLTNTLLYMEQEYPTYKIKGIEVITTNHLLIPEK